MQHVKIKSIQRITNPSKRYDVTVEDNSNYFANGILIHNCNGRFTYRDGRLWVGSRTRIKAPYQGSDGVERNLWWKVAKDLRLEEKFALLPGDDTRALNTRSTVVLYGEVYGQVQDLRYGIDKGATLRVFDTYSVTADRYNNWDGTLSICKTMGLETVPELYRGPWKPELEEMRNGPSVLYPGHIREGFVVKPVQERHVQFVPGNRHAFTGRVIFKAVGEDYKTRKKKG
jgi:RNA ligase (TIGR02306 family)